MVFNATFNNISVISWQSVLLVEETRVPDAMTNRKGTKIQTIFYNTLKRKLKIEIHETQ
jgi:hypothetical protein